MLNALPGLHNWKGSHTAPSVALRTSQSSQKVDSFLFSIRSFSLWRARLCVLLSGGLILWYRGIIERRTYVYPQITGAAPGKDQGLLCGIKDWDPQCSQPTWDVSGLSNRENPKARKRHLEGLCPSIGAEGRLLGLFPRPMSMPWLQRSSAEAKGSCVDRDALPLGLLTSAEGLPVSWGLALIPSLTFPLPFSSLRVAHSEP